MPTCVIAESASATRATPPTPATTLPWTTLLLSAYGLGVAVLILRLVGGLYTLHRIRQSATPLADPYWQRLMQRAAHQVGLPRGVPLALSDRINVPITLGTVNPTILLPDYVIAGMQPNDHRAILLHELTHVRRRDFAWQLLHHVVFAVYWPHPLVWFARRCIDTARERVCDEVCVHHLGDANAYRRTLLDVAGRLLSRPRLAAGLTMARAGGLRQRLDGIRGTQGLAECAPSRKVRLGLLAMVVGCTGAVAPLRLAAVQPQPTLKAQQVRQLATELRDAYADVDPRTLPPAQLATLYFAALATQDVEQLELLTSGRLAQRNPAEWHRLARHIVDATDLARNFPALFEVATHEEFTALTPAADDQTDPRLVLIIRECPWERWSVVAKGIVPTEIPVDQLLDQGLKWFAHDLDPEHTEFWIDVPELQP